MDRTVGIERLRRYLFTLKDFEPFEVSGQEIQIEKQFLQLVEIISGVNDDNATIDEIKRAAAKGRMVKTS